MPARRPFVVGHLRGRILTLLEGVARAGQLTLARLEPCEHARHDPADSLHRHTPTIPTAVPAITQIPPAHLAHQEPR